MSISLLTTTLILSVVRFSSITKALTLFVVDEQSTPLCYEISSALRLRFAGWAAAVVITACIARGMDHETVSARANNSQSNAEVSEMECALNCACSNTATSTAW
eukprot:m.213467 g.213467  ORF g.213467 m.213467 type:complete len:104 (-) comp54034_c0_seq1:1570-1881(-)